MTERETFIVRHTNPRWREVAERAVAALRLWAERGEVEIRLGEVTRTLDQNAAMWPALTDFAKQVPWPHTVGGRWVIDLMSKESWKAVLTAAFEQQTETAQGLAGGSVMVGASTSKYGKRKMGDFLTFVRAEGNERGVIWSEKAKDSFDEYIDSRRAA